MSKLYALLGVEKGVTAVIGSGGKTGLLAKLCQELPGTVILCTSTRIYPFDLPLITERVETLPAHIEEWADKIYASQQYNFMKWDILTTVIGGPRPDEHWNAVALSQKDAQTFEAEVARLNAYFERTAEKMDRFIRTLG